MLIEAEFNIFKDYEPETLTDKIKEFIGTCSYYYFYVSTDKELEKLPHNKIPYVNIDINSHDPFTKYIDYIIILTEFEYNGDRYIAWYILKDMEIPDIKVMKYCYKRKDTYIIGERKIFDKIDQIIYAQGLEREKIGKDCISSTYMNELMANKIEYHLWLIKHGLIKYTDIEEYGHDKTKKGYYIKAPYSSGTGCVVEDEFKKLKKLCYLDEGVIVQKKNYSLRMFELKCQVINGEIHYILVKRLDKPYVCVDNNFKSTDKAIERMINKNKKYIIKLCKKAYRLINHLVMIRIHKIHNDNLEINKIFRKLYDKGIQLNDETKNNIRFTLNSLVVNKKKCYC